MVEFCEQSAIFVFLNGYLRVVVDFYSDESNDLGVPLIDLITVQSALTGMYLKRPTKVSNIDVV